MTGLRGWFLLICKQQTGEAAQSVQQLHVHCTVHSRRKNKSPAIKTSTCAVVLQSSAASAASECLRGCDAAPRRMLR